jgi:hypothetical protein
MSLMLDAARVAAALNVVLLVVLVGVWVRNYREIRAPLTLGSVVFGSFLLAENLVAFYFYTTAPEMPVLALRFTMMLQVLEFLGIAALAYVTWR